MDANMQLDLIRAWKDEEYRESLSPQQREMLASHPAGLIELNDEELGGVEGGTTWTISVLTVTLALSHYYHCAMF